MRLNRFKSKYILRTEYDADGVWLPATADEVFDRNPQITDEHAAFAEYSFIEEWNWYGSPEIKGRTYRLAVYKQRPRRTRLIQVEPIPPVRNVVMNNIKWPTPDKD